MRTRKAKYNKIKEEEEEASRDSPTKQMKGGRLQMAMREGALLLIIAVIFAINAEIWMKLLHFGALEEMGKTHLSELEAIRFDHYKKTLNLYTPMVYQQISGSQLTLNYSLN